MAPQYPTRFDLNSQIARANRATLDAAGVTAISLVGPAGSGKTTLIETLLTRLNPKLRMAAIVGDLAAERQVERMTRHGCRAIPLVTDNLAAINLREALGGLNLNELDLLLIESEDNAHSPVEFDLGHHLRASVFSVAGGDDKATEYPFLIARSDVVLLTKIDLLPSVKFDFKVFNQDVMRVKAKMPIIQLSLQSNQGIGQWVQWVEAHLSPRVQQQRLAGTADPFIRIPNE
ncbi:MAG: hydrogenase nickel incorporation protein HypB [Tepidisphaeraceae bacterium]|jgi:hydrogenase nickel incorporation protein HypB